MASFDNENNEPKRPFRSPHCISELVFEGHNSTFRFSCKLHLGHILPHEEMGGTGNKAYEIKWWDED